MKKLILPTLALTALLGAANAADMGASTSPTEMPAVATPSSTNPTAPVQGHNSFTKKQATDRIKKAGYTNLNPLVKGEDGVWRTTAKKDGKGHDVSLDYQGNITATDK